MYRAGPTKYPYAGAGGGLRLPYSQRVAVHILDTAGLCHQNSVLEHLQRYLLRKQPEEPEAMMWDTELVGRQSGGNTRKAKLGQLGLDGAQERVYLST